MVGKKQFVAELMAQYTESAESSFNAVFTAIHRFNFQQNCPLNTADSVKVVHYGYPQIHEAFREFCVEHTAEAATADTVDVGMDSLFLQQFGGSDTSRVKSYLEARAHDVEALPMKQLAMLFHKSHVAN